MSKYLIYRVDYPDPELKGKQRRRLNIIIIIGVAILPALYLIVYETFNISFLILYPAFLIVSLTVSFIIQHRLNKENKKIIPIGEIEFTRTGITKQIGDIISKYKYDEVESIELKKHIPVIKMNEGKEGYFTYILTISFIDSRKEKMILSSNSAGKFKSLDLSETVRTLGKITPVKTIIK